VCYCCKCLDGSSIRAKQNFVIVYVAVYITFAQIFKKIMKKNFIIVCLLLALTSKCTNRNRTSKLINPSELNKWSIELNYGVNKPARPFTTVILNASFLQRRSWCSLHVQQKFGIKGDVGYYNFQSNDSSVLSLNTRGSIQGVVNMGRVFTFENWTSRLCINSRWSWLCAIKSRRKDFTDRMGTFMIGVTGQVKLTNVLF
jgi:OOP family OmpA-OmpF porin